MNSSGHHVIWFDPSKTVFLDDSSGTDVVHITVSPSDVSIKSLAGSTLVTYLPTGTTDLLIGVQSVDFAVPVAVNVTNVSVAENQPIAASSLITSIANPSGDNITQYGFWMEGPETVISLSMARSNRMGSGLLSTQAI